MAADIRNKYKDNKFSFVDCMILAQAQNYELQVLTAEIAMQNYTKVKVGNPLS